MFSFVDTVVGNGISPTELSKQAALKLSLSGFQINIYDSIFDWLFA